MDSNTYSIMVVEDERLLLQAITKKLQIKHIEAVSCASGQQAFDYLESMPELPKAIWLDYHLGDMDGIAFMNRLKSNIKWVDIPVLIVSNSASDDKIHSMLALGAKKYVLKAEHRLDEIIESFSEFLKEK